MIGIKHIYYCTVFFLLFSVSSIAFSGPWLTPSSPWPGAANLATKSDIDLLSSYGFIKAPVLTWPIAWDNIGPSLLSPTSKKQIKTAPSYVQQTYFRVLSQYREAMGRSVQTSAYLSGGSNINPFRTFEFQPRGDFNGGVSSEKQGEKWAAKLAVNYGNYNDLTKNVHLDDSYFYGFLGNWGLGFDKMNRWWGPGYSDTMILSANAPPLPTFTIQRMQAKPFQSKWLRWIGPWSLTTSLSVGGEDAKHVVIQHPLIWLTNLSFRPIESLQFSLSRNVFFAGETRPLNWGMMQNLVTFQDNIGMGGVVSKEEPGTEHAEATVQWSPKNVFPTPTTFYLQTIFNDAYGFYNHRVVIPWRTSFLLGASSIFPIHENSLRLFQNGWWLWNKSGGHIITNIYGYSIYPYYYYGKIIGSPLGGETKALSLGAIYSQLNGNSYTFLIRFLGLNEFNAQNILGYPGSRQNILWLSIGRSFVLPQNVGELSGQLGYLKAVTPPEGPGFKSAPSAFLTWSKKF
jgi:hypothetical protein